MRYHVYSEARHPLGPVAAGNSLRIYDDAAGTVISHIYAAASGGSPLANPYIVPSTGVVDFWATVSRPYIESGDGVKQPLPILVATPTDIGAAGLTADNVLTGTQTISGKKLIVSGGSAVLSDFGQIEVDSGSVDTVASIGFLDNGLKVANYGCDPEAATICVYSGEHTGVRGVQDRFAIGRQAPYRVVLGLLDTGIINDAGQPFFLFEAANADLGELCAELTMPHSQAGNVLSVRGDWSSDLPIFRLNSAGDMRVYGSIILSDGDDLYAITVDAGTLVATLVARNYATNPSFELDTNSDGLANGITPASDTAYTPTLVAGRTGGLAQRFVVAPAGAGKYLSVDLTAKTGVGTFAPADPMTASFYYKLAHTGCTITPYVTSWTAAGGYIGDEAGSALDNHANWTRATISVASLAATTSQVHLQMLSGTTLDAGDTLDITIDDVQIEKSATATDYFDGSYKGCNWSAVENASQSYKG